MNVLRRCLLGCLLLISGCATLPDSEELEVSLVDVRPVEATAWETTAQFTVRLQNSSPDPMTLDGGAYKIYLNDTYVGQGLSGERVELPRLGTATQVVTLHLKNFTLARKIYGASKTLQASYRVRSTLYVLSKEGRGSRTLRTTKEGSLDLREFVPASERGAIPTMHP
jgi:LEA14-like dessication related protein